MHKSAVGREGQVRAPMVVWWNCTPRCARVQVSPLRLAALMPSTSDGVTLLESLCEGIMCAVHPAPWCRTHELQQFLLFFLLCLFDSIWKFFPCLESKGIANSGSVVDMC